MLEQVKEIEDLMRFADVPDTMTKARALALSIARKAPDTIATRALELLEVVNAFERSGKAPRADDIQLSKTLWRLRVALQNAQKDDVTR